LSATVGCLDCSRIGVWRNSKALDFNSSRLGTSGSCANLGDVYGVVLNKNVWNDPSSIGVTRFS
jgi:hypothetical protein